MNGNQRNVSFSFNFIFSVSFIFKIKFPTFLTVCSFFCIISNLPNRRSAIHTYRSTPKFGMKTSTLPPNIGYRNGYSSVSFHTTVL